VQYNTFLYSLIEWQAQSTWAKRTKIQCKNDNVDKHTDQ